MSTKMNSCDCNFSFSLLLAFKHHYSLFYKSNDTLNTYLHDIKLSFNFSQFYSQFLNLSNKKKRERFTLISNSPDHLLLTLKVALLPRKRKANQNRWTNCINQSVQKPYLSWEHKKRTKSENQQKRV